MESKQIDPSVMQVALRKESVDRNMICLPRGIVLRNGRSPQGERG